MSHCPLCGNREFTFEKRPAERSTEVHCTQCHRFVIEDDWLNYLQKQPISHSMIRDLEKLTNAAAKMGFVFNISERVLGRAPCA